MPKTSKNQLTLEAIKDESGAPILNGIGKPLYRLFGYINGEKIRKQSHDLVKLELIKTTTENAAAAQARQDTEAMSVRQTRLTKDQLGDAEAAFRILPFGRSLLECVTAANSVLGTGEPVECEKSLLLWHEQMKDRRLKDKSVKNNLSSARLFLRHSKIKMLHEATPRLIEKFVRQPGFAGYTQLGLAGKLHAWFSFCIAEKWLQKNPVELDIAELRERARPIVEPEILTVEQAQALLTAAVEQGDLAIIFYVIVATWCFVRTAEVCRLTKENFIIRQTNGVVTEIIIHLRGDKLGSRWRDVPVPANVLPLLVEVIKRGAFSEKTGKIKFSSWLFKQTRADAGLHKIAYRANKPHAPILEDSEWAPNILRHTGMSYLFQEMDGDIDLVTRRAGNSAGVAFMHYLRRVEPDAFKKFNAVTATLPIIQGNSKAVA